MCIVHLTLRYPLICPGVYFSGEFSCPVVHLFGYTIIALSHCYLTSTPTVNVRYMEERSVSMYLCSYCYLNL